MSENYDHPTIAWYITPHGFGHAVRSLEVIRRFMSRVPEVRLTIVSDLPDFLIEQHLGIMPSVRRKRLDVGMVQKDSLRFDLDATRATLEKLRQSHDRLVDEEKRFLLELGADVMVSDIAFIPFYAADRAGIPGIGMGNFTWDWIYSSYRDTDERWDPLIEWCRGGYRLCDLLLRLPMHGDCSSCPRITDVPLVARQPSRTRRESRAILGCEKDRKAYLVSFSELHLDESALRRLERMNNALFLFKRPLRFDFANGRSIDDLELSYVDVVGAMDAVITKPGYGIVSDCLATGTPMIYTDRGPFPEYDILVREMNRHLNTVYLSSEDFCRGAWESAAEQIEGMPSRAVSMRLDGADVCVGLILDCLAELEDVKAGTVGSRNGAGRRQAGMEAEVESPVVVPVEDSIDLHTYRPADIRDLLDDYLEAAREKGFEQVRIIHGKGTGALRAMVQSILRRHPLVLSFREADGPGGGWGATLARLRPAERNGC